MDAPSIFLHQPRVFEAPVSLQSRFSLSRGGFSLYNLSRLLSRQRADVNGRHFACDAGACIPHIFLILLNIANAAQDCLCFNFTILGTFLPIYAWCFILSPMKSLFLFSAYTCEERWSASYHSFLGC